MFLQMLSARTVTANRGAASEAGEQGSANFFSNGTERKYFRHCRSTISVTTTRVCCSHTKAVVEDRQRAWLSPNKTLSLGTET